MCGSISIGDRTLMQRTVVKQRAAESADMARHGSLPPNLPPACVTRDRAAEYAGGSGNTCDKRVGEGRMPKARRIDGRRVWIVCEVAAAINDLPIDGAAVGDDDTWGDVDAKEAATVR